jgi:phosphatidylglycerophosphatase A
MPWAPGTFGSLVGVGWVALLWLAGSYGLFLAGMAAGIVLSVWVCGRAEEILARKDPPSVVLDEIVAMPVCFLPWTTAEWLRTGALPHPDALWAAKTWWWTLLLFALFRVFDIAKPWPVRQSQRLPGGWGVTVDDILAAIYVALLSLPLVL